MSLPRTRGDVKLNTKTSSSSFLDSEVLHKKSKVEESDEELLMVPDVEATRSEPANSKKTNGVSTSNDLHSTNNSNLEIQNQSGCPAKRRRGRNPVDKEYRRLKRLLRNRVSAQQARERKKVYVNDLESRATELQDIKAELEEKISTLINENAMLRKVLMNTRPKADEKAETKQDQLITVDGRV